MGGPWPPGFWSFRLRPGQRTRILPRSRSYALIPAESLAATMRSVLVRGERGALRAYFRSAGFVSYRGDAETVLHELGSASADCVVTSPPFFSVRHDLTVPGEIDHETTVDAYVARLARVGRELLRVVKRRGSLG